MNINAINYSNQEEAVKKASINIKNNVGSQDEKNASQILSTGMVSGIGATTSTKSMQQNAKALMHEAEDVIEQLKESAENAKGSLNALFKKLSGADCVKLDEDGYGLNDTKPEKIITVVERIKIMLATYCEDYQVMGSSVDMDEIKEVVGSTGLASKVADKLQGYDVPATGENVQDIKDTLDELQKTGTLSDNAKNYLIKNNMEPTIDNVYNAQHKSAGQVNAAQKLTEEEWAQLKPQVENVISRAGLEVNEDNINNARGFMEYDIPVTEENLQYKALLDAIDMTSFNEENGIDDAIDAMAAAISDGKPAGCANLTEKPAIWREVANAINTANAADEADVCSVIESGDELTLQNLSKAVDGRQEHDAQELAQRIKSMTGEEIAGYRRLEEIRILMTADAGLSLAKQGFNLNTEPIAKLVEELKKMELALAEQSKDEDANALFEVQKAVYDISSAPVDLIGAVFAENEIGSVITLEAFAQTGASLRQRYREAGKTYEAVGTQVRRDLGDSVIKAVDASTSDLLDSLGLEDNKANREAIRILGSNGMEITQENVDKVKGLYAEVKSLINNMKPQAVLSMIRDGKNPMKSDIKDVNEYLAEVAQSESKEEKFSTFLYKLDRTGGITEEERRQFIGIYRMINIFTKDAGRAVGALMQQGADITMGNLITAYNSRRAAGIDKIINDTDGMTEVTGTVNYYNTLFAANADKITPRTLKLVNDEEKIDTRSVEGFIEAVDENYDLRSEAEYYEEYLDSLKNVREADESVVRELARFDSRVSIAGIQAMQEIMQEGWNCAALKGLKDDKKSKAMEMLENLDDENKTAEILKELESDVKDDISNALESVENRQELENLRMRSREIVMLGSMAKKHDYRIPFDNNGSMGTIHLQFVQDEENAGRIAIDTDTDLIGKIYIEARAGKDGVFVFAITDGREEELKERLSAAAEEIENMTYQVGKSDMLPQTQLPVSDKDISSGELYTIAKKLVKSVIA